MENEVNANEEVRELTLAVDVQERSACERHIKIEVSREDVDFYFDREYELFRESRPIPGFRAGKAPRKLIEKRFHKEVVERVKNSLILDSISQMNKEQNLTTISEPQIDPNAIIVPETGPFVYEFDIEVRPTFDIPNWKGVKLEKLVHEFTPAEIDAAIARIQTSYGRLVDKGAPAELGDYIVTKLTFLCDGKELRSSDHETLRIRKTLSFRDCTINDFGKLVEGVVPGDTRSTKVSLSEDVPTEDLRGKEIEAVFDIVEVKKAEIPELNEEFLQMLGGFENMGDFRDVVLEELKRQMEYEQQQRVRRQIALLLTEGADWELPPQMLKRQQARELQRAYYEYQRSGFTDEQINSQRNQLIQNAKASTAQALKEHFILEAIAESEGIDVEERDFELEIMLIAAQTGESPRRVRARIDRDGTSDILRNQIIERKVIDLIMKSAEFTEVPYQPPTLTDEAVDWSASGDEDEEEIPEVTEEDAKAANREATDPDAAKGM